MPYYHGGRMDKDFVNEFEEYLTKKGFDLECITQFNEEYLEKFREEQNEKTN